MQSLYPPDIDKDLCVWKLKHRAVLKMISSDLRLKDKHLFDVVYREREKVVRSSNIVINEFYLNQKF